MFKKLLTLGLVILGAMTLSACDNGPTVEEILADIQEAQDELVLPSSATSDLTLPTSGLHDVEISWESSNTDYITDAGKVTMPTKTQGDKKVTMTATLTLSEQSLTKTFDVTLTAAAEYTKAEIAQAAADMIVLPVSGIITVTSIDLPATGQDDAAITWTTSNADVITAAGVVTRPAVGESNAKVTLTASITVDGVTATKAIEVIVAAEEPAAVFTTVADLHASTLGDIIEFTGTVSSTFNGGYFLTDGTNAIGIYHTTTIDNLAIGDVVHVKGEYAKYNTLFQLKNLTTEEKVTDGTATTLAPITKTAAEVLALDTSDPLTHGMAYRVTGVVTLGKNADGYDSIFVVDGTNKMLIYYNSDADAIELLEDHVGYEVTLDLILYTDHSRNGILFSFVGSKATDFVAVTLTDAGAVDASEAIVQSAVGYAAAADLTLPTTDANGVAVTNWKSSDTTIFSDAGVWAAPTLTEATEVTFTADVAKGTETGTITVKVLVPVMADIIDVLDYEDGEAFYVEGEVIEVSYYGVFIYDGTAPLFIKTSELKLDDDTAVVKGDVVVAVGTLGTYSGLLQAYTDSVTAGTATIADQAAVAGTIEGIANDVYVRGSYVTVTGTVSLEGKYNTVTLTGLTGETIEVYYRSNADEIGKMVDDAAVGFVGKTITLTVVPYQNGSVLFQGVAADVTEETSYAATDAEKAQAAADAIVVEGAYMAEDDLTLPTTGDFSSTIAWATSDAAVVTDAGVVTPVGGEEAMATLTATVTVGTETATRMIKVVLKDLNDVEMPTTIAVAVQEADGTEVLVEGVVIGFEYGKPYIQDANGAGLFVDTKTNESDFDGLEIGDKVVIRGTLYTDTYGGDQQRQLGNYYGGLDSHLVKVVSSDNPIYVLTTVTPETIVNLAPFYNGYKVKTTLTIKALKYNYNNESKYEKYVEFEGNGTTTIIYDPWGLTDGLHDMAVGDEVMMEFIVQDFYKDAIRITNAKVFYDAATQLVIAEDDLYLSASVTEDLELPAMIKDLDDVTITWATSDATVIAADGTVTRPAIGEADGTVKLTATISAGSETPVTKEFDITVPALQPAQVGEIFISEYVEGGGYNKVIEIYNGTNVAVDLSQYTLRYYSAGGTSYSEFTLSESGISLLAVGEVLVLANNNSQITNTDILTQADFQTGFINHNGDDCYELVKGDTVIDSLGTWGDVDFGKDKTLVRNADITAPNSTYTVAEWTVLAKDTTSNVGSHTQD